MTPESRFYRLRAEFASLIEDPVLMIRLRLKKSDKLRLRNDFEQVRRDGRTAAGSYLLANVAPGDGQVKCGVICSRKFSTLAVRRNRARRLLWESFRLLKPAIAPCRMVLIPRKGIMKAMQPQVMEELKRLLKQSRVYFPEQDSAPER